ncbi:MAG: aminotransferase class V-fold PLP-dependent enzyme [Betaproteobacteria bacterium]
MRLGALAAHYSRFRVSERLLFTGHSHQAWPDCAFDGQMQALEDAARLLDDKWANAFAMAERYRTAIAQRLGDDDGFVALGPSTHDLLIRLLSALPWRTRRRIVTTDGEYHSARRQFDRLEEEGIEVVRAPAGEVDDLAGDLAAAIDDRTLCVLVSHVMFRTGRIVPGLNVVAEACRRHGAALVVDMYHSVNVVPVNLRDLSLEDAFVLGGGYKYMQCGEGNCFLRFPRDCRLRPIVTGWFAEFGAITAPATRGGVPYADGAARFAGATYDPTSHYRAAAVMDFFDAMELTPPLLRAISQHQVSLLAASFDALDLDPRIVMRPREVPVSALGGFLAFESPQAGVIHAALRERGVLTDYRDRCLRFGPAPYISDRQVVDATEALGEVARAMAAGAH